MADRAISIKELKFVEAYVRTGNGVQAAMDAGYGGSRDACGVRACRLLKRPAVRAALSIARLELTRRSKLTADEVIEGFRREAFTAESDGARVKALEGLARIKGLFKDRMELTEKLTPEQRRERIEILVAAGLRRKTEETAEGGAE